MEFMLGILNQLQISDVSKNSYQIEMNTNESFLKDSSKFKSYQLLYIGILPLYFRCKSNISIELEVI